MHNTFCILSYIQNKAMVQNKRVQPQFCFPPATPQCVHQLLWHPFSQWAQFFSKKLWRKNFTSVEIHLVSIFSMQVQNLSLQTYCLFHAIPKAWSPTNIHKGPFSFCLSFLDVWRFLLWPRFLLSWSHWLVYSTRRGFPHTCSCAKWNLQKI